MGKDRKLTEEHKQKIKQKTSGENHYFWGKHHTEETKRKMAESHKGKKASKETLEKMSNAKRGEKSPLWGKSPSKSTRMKISEKNKGRTFSEDTKRKISESKKGIPHNNEAKQKMSRVKKGRFTGEENPNWKGGLVKILCKTCGKEKKVQVVHIRNGGGKFCSRKCVAIWTIKHMKKKETVIERLMENELNRRGIPYTKQVPLLGITLVDFLLPHDIVIYADGDYWHSKSHVKERDMNQDFMLGFYGYKVFRFTETEIKKSTEKCLNKALRKFQK